MGAIFHFTAPISRISKPGRNAAAGGGAGTVGGILGLVAGTPLPAAIGGFLSAGFGETITEIEHAAVAIPAAEWPTYSSERFPREVAEWQRRLDADSASR